MKKDEGTEQEPQAEAPKEEVQPQAEPKAETPTADEQKPAKQEKQRVDVVRTWRAKQACMLPWRDFERDETVELKDSQVTPLIRKLFECLDGGTQVAAEKPDPDLAVMVARLKAAKIPIKKGTPAEEIRKLFDKFLGSGATAGEISEEAAK